MIEASSSHPCVRFGSIHPSEKHPCFLCGAEIGQESSRCARCTYLICPKCNRCYCSMSIVQKKTWSDIHATFCMNLEKLKLFSISDMDAIGGDSQVSVHAASALSYCRDIVNGQGTVERIENWAPKPIRDLFSLPYQWFEFLGTCLDVGCGERGSRNKWVGVDSAKLDILYVRASALSLPFRDKSFSTVTCFETIEHAGQRNEQVAVIREMTRVATQRVIVGSVNRTGPSTVGGIEVYKGSRNPYHTRELDPGEFLELVREIQFPASFYHSIEDRSGNIQMKRGLGGLVNYGVVNLR